MYQECSRYATISISKDLFVKNVDATQNQLNQQLALKSILGNCFHVEANLNDIFPCPLERSCYPHPAICQSDLVFLKISSQNVDSTSVRYSEGCYFPCM